MMGVLWLSILFSFAAAPPDLASIRTEKNLEKRAGLAMDFASHRVDTAREAWQAGKPAEMAAALQEIGDAVELAQLSLKQTGKKASKSPKHFKRAELAARNLLRRLDSLINDLSVDEREPAEKTRARVHRVQESLLLDIMTPAKRR
ncbi:MAG: hypothetical protein HY822_02790 [Acidobacteria bacterium]|nr:hypothetical protein [Acidobacteriota bacterium]